jgi:hypothetical protein
MPALSAYINTENTALVILQRKGFRLWFNNAEGLYYAEKGGWDFSAQGATELLGVIAIFEHHVPSSYKEYWWKIDDPWLKDALPDRPHQYQSVMSS